MILILSLPLFLAALVWWWYEGPPAERRAAKALAKAKCAEVGHVWGPVENALDSPWFPFRRCQRCKVQELLKRCAACGRCLQSGRLFEEETDEC